MEFDSEEAAYIFYNEYARKMGFSVRKEQVVKNKKTGEVTSRIYSCSKEGYQSKDKRGLSSVGLSSVGSFRWLQSSSRGYYIWGGVDV